MGEMPGKVQGTRIARLHKLIRDRKVIITYFRVQLPKASHDLQAAINDIAQFDRSSSPEATAELIPPSSTSVDATQSVISDHPIQTQIISELIRNFQSSNPRLRHRSP
jgi:hypothetical protein